MRLTETWHIHAPSLQVLRARNAVGHKRTYHLSMAFSEPFEETAALHNLMHSTFPTNAYPNAIITTSAGVKHGVQKCGVTCKSYTLAGLNTPHHSSPLGCNYSWRIVSLVMKALLCQLLGRRAQCKNNSDAGSTSMKTRKSCKTSTLLGEPVREQANVRTRNELMWHYLYGESGIPSLGRVSCNRCHVHTKPSTSI